MLYHLTRFLNILILIFTRILLAKSFSVLLNTIKVNAPLRDMPGILSNDTTIPCQERNEINLNRLAVRLEAEADLRVSAYTARLLLLASWLYADSFPRLVSASVSTLTTSEAGLSVRKHMYVLCRMQMYRSNSLALLIFALFSAPKINFDTLFHKMRFPIIVVSTKTDY